MDINGIVRNIVVIGLNDCLFCLLGALEGLAMRWGVEMVEEEDMDMDVDMCDDLLF